MCTATVRSANLIALETTYDRVDDEPAVWHELVPGKKQIRAILAVEGAALQVQSTSGEQMDRVLGVLAELDPALTVLDDVRSDSGTWRTSTTASTSIPLPRKSLPP